MESVSPLTIKVMLACYVSPAPEGIIGRECWMSSAGREVRHWLFKQGLIHSEHEVTEKGKAWVDAICSTPLPEQIWIIPRAKESGQ